MIYQLNIDEFLKQSREQLILDVRSEGEYNYGRIVGATNLPLFNNEERKIVGTAYKQKGREEAILIGMDFVGKKMSEFVRFAREHATGKKIFVHCWRGGMRSEGMAWLMNLNGFEVGILKGGYKSYRHHALDILSKNFRFIVLGGRTGSGKTKILQHLRETGEQVLDLEALANHKGSAFGAIGQLPQPSTEQFENLLSEEMDKLDINKPIWLEDESKTIGKVFLDLNFWNNMKAAPLVVIDLPLKKRVKNLMNEYGTYPAQSLKESFEKIERRLGGEQCKNAISAIQSGDIEQATRIALHYYDKAYDKSIAMNEHREITRLAFDDDDEKNIAQALVAEVKKQYGN